MKIIEDTCSTGAQTTAQRHADDASIQQLAQATTHATSALLGEDHTARPLLRIRHDRAAASARRRCHRRARRPQVALGYAEKTAAARASPAALPSPQRAELLVLSLQPSGAPTEYGERLQGTCVPARSIIDSLRSARTLAARHRDLNPRQIDPIPRAGAALPLRPPSQQERTSAPLSS